MKTLLSYPRSGNHLVRFFIELLTEQPTLGLLYMRNDIPIFQNIFPEKIPFNISSLSNYDSNILYRKEHNQPKNVPTELICIVRNPREVLLRNLHYLRHRRDKNWKICDPYFDCFDYYSMFQGKKCLFFYEDICTDKITFIEQLYDFLDVKNESKKEYVLKNIDSLFELSKLGKNRAWGGVNSTSIHYYYEKIQGEDKLRFDDYIQTKIDSGKYDILKAKYSL